jgi:hypothetical protein
VTAFCPYCRRPVPSLLSECPLPACSSAFLDEDAVAAFLASLVDDVPDRCQWCGRLDCDDRERHARYDELLPATGTDWTPP